MVVGVRSATGYRVAVIPTPAAHTDTPIDQKPEPCKLGEPLIYGQPPKLCQNQPFGWLGTEQLSKSHQLSLSAFQPWEGRSKPL